MRSSIFTVNVQYAILIALNVIDFCFTRPLVNLSGPMAEGNPVMEWMIRQFGVFGILYWKLFFLLLFGVVILAASEKLLRRLVVIIGAINLGLLWVVIWGGICYFHTFPIHV